MSRIIGVACYFEEKDDFCCGEFLTLGILFLQGLGDFLLHGHHGLLHLREGLDLGLLGGFDDGGADGLFALAQGVVGDVDARPKRQ